MPWVAGGVLLAQSTFTCFAECTAVLLHMLFNDTASPHHHQPVPPVAESYQPTSFGKAVLASSLPPELCMHVRSDLARARESFVLTTELHLTYLCVPPTESLAPRWDVLYALLNKLQVGGGEGRCAGCIGEQLAFLSVCVCLSVWHPRWWHWFMHGL